MKKFNINDYKTFMFDLDGTIWYWSELIPGAREVVEKLRKMGKKVIFLTNNSAESRENLAKRLTKLGIPAKKNDMLTVSYMASVFLNKKKARVMVFGDGLAEDLKEAGVDIRQKLPVDYVIVGDDMNFTTDKISLALEAIRRGATLLTCNIGRYRYDGKKIIAGAGSLVRSIEYGAKVNALVVGKPSENAVEIVKKAIKNPKKTVIVGDDTHDDIKLAKKLGCFSILINKKEDKDADITLNSIKDMLNII